jgi:hypothetical protein
MERNERRNEKTKRGTKVERAEAKKKQRTEEGGKTKAGIITCIAFVMARFLR